MNVTLRDHRPDNPAQSHLGFIDCDVHPFFRTPADFDPFLSERWREHRRTIGNRSRQALARTSLYPRMSPGNGMRGDSWPKDGSPPGSDLALMREQLLDLFGVRYGLLAPLVGGAAAERNVEFGAAMAVAVNEWQCAKFCDPEPRLKASVQLTLEHEASALAEIERRAGDPRFAQVNIPPRGLEPLGRHRYRKILAASAAAGFPISLHLGGTSGHASTGGGWPSFYHEEHPSYVQSMQTLVTSLVCEGVFEEIPDLKVVLVEGGFAWLPALAWRLDKHWKRLRAEVPHLRRAPSEQIREHIWVTTQPMEEPQDHRHALDTMESIGWDRLLFASDYPHWDFDDPFRAFPAGMPRDRYKQILTANARSVYRLA